MTGADQASRSTARWSKAYHDAVIMGENPIGIYVSQRDYNVWVRAATGQSPKRGDKYMFMGVPLHPRRTLQTGYHAVIVGD